MEPVVAYMGGLIAIGVVVLIFLLLNNKMPKGML